MFLSWNDHNIDKDPVDFAMCVHVFRGASSTSCANYTLRRTSVDKFESVKDLDTPMDLMSQILYQTESNN